MADPRFNRDKAVAALVYAAEHGDANACEHFRLSLRTLQNYRRRLSADWDLVRKLAQTRRRLDEDWSMARRRFLNQTIPHLQLLVLRAGVDDIAMVCLAIKTVGELEVVSGVLGTDATDDVGPTGESE